jgi:ATP-dependent 26S proteasome regulatory subunit
VAKNQLDEIDVLIRARYPLLYILSSEESRVTSALAGIALQQQKRFHLWTETLGLHSGRARVIPDIDHATADPLEALEKIRRDKEPAIYLMKDLPLKLGQHPEAGALTRKLRDLGDALRTTYSTLVILSPRLLLPPELEKEVTVIDFDLPGFGELEGLLEQALIALKSQGKEDAELSLEKREAILKAARGLTLTEAENVFAKCLVEKKGFAVAEILEEKKQIIRKGGLLEYYDAVEPMASVGGMEDLKAWLQRRALAFTEKAKAFGLPAPKGVLLLGVQGCGKSLTAKAVAHLWQMPLLRLDVGAIFSGLVGSSEENMRRAIKMAEAVSPTIFWIDEIEKALSGTQSSGQLDAGVTARVFATLTTWLQEKTKPVFVVATANNILQLPPELLRKGRFDEIFFVDLPRKEERKAIFAIHLEKRKRDPARLDLERLAAATEGFSGSEIEQCLISALYTAFEADRDITSEDLARAVAETVPLSVTMREEIEKSRAWARGRARAASCAFPEEAEGVPPLGRRE